MAKVSWERGWLTTLFTVEVVHGSIYRALMTSQGISPDAPEVDEAAFLKSPSANHNNSNLHIREDCDFTTSVVTDSTQTFIDWDVQMSPVVIGTGSGIDVSVSSGYSVSNAVSASAGIDLTFIKDKLGASGGIDYTRTWTTQTAVNTKGTVANGYSGVMVTKPVKTRKTGRALKGCIGSETEAGTFQADSYDEGSYGELNGFLVPLRCAVRRNFLFPAVREVEILSEPSMSLSSCISTFLHYFIFQLVFIILRLGNLGST